MQNLGPKEAADRIRDVFFSDRSSRADPEDAHRMEFAKEVLRELGAGDTAEDVRHVMQLLREHDIELHAGHEFPKYATRNWDGTRKIVQNAEEEKQWVEEARPDLADAPRAFGPVLDAPVQDLDFDLRNKVPHAAGDAPQPERVPRVPSAITNREAAQDAYARQPNDGGTNHEAAAAAYDRANSGLDHQNQGAARGTREFVDHGEHVDNGEVHVEDLAPVGGRDQGGSPYAKPAGVGVVAHDDPDGDGVAGQDANPTHDSVLGSDEPQRRSGDSSAGKTDTARRPVGIRRPQ